MQAYHSCRFISPAVVAPEIVDVDVPKEDNFIRRGLMIIAKIIQNLANNIFFGKEQHMMALNPFLGENIVNVTRYLSELNVRSCTCALGNNNNNQSSAEIRGDT
jgi:neurofibromin 1